MCPCGPYVRARVRRWVISILSDVMCLCLRVQPPTHPPHTHATHHTARTSAGGWRFDFVKGYAGEFVQEYVDATLPKGTFCVGEFWVDLRCARGVS